MKLRPGIKFHDGTPFNADAVVFSIKRIIDPKFNSEQISFFNTIKDAARIDDLTVRIVTDGPDPILLSRLYWMKMVPPAHTASAKFAESFDDEGAKAGWCLYKLGCKGPTTYNACATTKWNNGTSFPIEAGHPCIGCSEPDFWDGGGFYKSISVPTENISKTVVYAAAAAAAAGAAIGVASRSKKKSSQAAHNKVGVDDLEK